MGVFSTQIAAIAVSSMSAQWVAWKLKIPAIVFLLAFGFILGPMTHIIVPETLMGDLLKPAIAAAVAIILFEGALQLDFKELRQTRKAVSRVLIVGTPISWALISMAAHYIAGLEWAVAIVLGGVLIVTGPTVVIPMLRQARLNKNVSAILKWEGIVNDSVGIILAILAYEYFHTSAKGEMTAAFFVKYITLLGAIAVLSYLLGRVIHFVFERGYVPSYLRSPFLLYIAVAVFFACDALLHESGLIAVTVLGVTLANTHTASIEEIKRFKETVTIMLVSALFILLTADLDVSVMGQIDIWGMAFIFCLLFVIRPICFAVSSLGTNMTWREVALTGLIAPRGIVCAAMAGVIGPLLVSSGFADGQKILPICFAIVVISVVLHSLMIRPLARRLKLVSEHENGLILVGAYDWSIQLCEALKQKEHQVLLVDGSWERLAPARLANVPVHYGEILSEETDFFQNLTQYDRALIATDNLAYNSLAFKTLSHDYGTENVLSVQPEQNGKAERHKISEKETGYFLVSEDLTLEALSEKFKAGWRFNIVRVGKKDEDAGLIFPEESESCIHMGVLSPSGKLTFYFDNNVSRPSLREDDRLIVFQKKEDTAQEPKNKAEKDA